MLLCPLAFAIREGNIDSYCMHSQEAFHVVPISIPFHRIVNSMPTSTTIAIAVVTNAPSETSTITPKFIGKVL